MLSSLLPAATTDLVVVHIFCVIISVALLRQQILSKILPHFTLRVHTYHKCMEHVAVYRIFFLACLQ